MSSEKQGQPGEDCTVPVNPRGVGRAAEVFREYGAEIRAFIELHAQDRSEADDLFQEFFLSMVSARFPTKICSMKHYLYRAIINDMASRARYNKRYQQRLQVYAELRRYKGYQDDPGKMVLQAEHARQVFEKIGKQLPPREAEAVICRYEMDCDISEAAQYMGVQRRSVARYVCSGLKKIREIGLLRGRAHDDMSVPRKHL